MPYFPDGHSLRIPTDAYPFEMKDALGSFSVASNPDYHYPGLAACAGGSGIPIDSRVTLWITEAQMKFALLSGASQVNVDVTMGLARGSDGLWLNDCGDMAHVQPFGTSGVAFAFNLCAQSGQENYRRWERGLDFPLMVGGGVSPGSANFTYWPTCRFKIHGAGSGVSMAYDYLIRGFYKRTGDF